MKGLSGTFHVIETWDFLFSGSKYMYNLLVLSIIWTDKKKKKKGDERVEDKIRG